MKSSGCYGMRKSRKRLARGTLEAWLAHSDSRGSSRPSVNLVSFSQAHIAAGLLVDEGPPFEPGTARDASVILFALGASFQAGRGQYL